VSESALPAIFVNAGVRMDLRASSSSMSRRYTQLFGQFFSKTANRHFNCARPGR
jgi:hypothetical protein